MFANIRTKVFELLYSLVMLIVRASANVGN